MILSTNYSIVRVKEFLDGVIPIVDREKNFSRSLFFSLSGYTE
jgi:hypothetical protein